MKQQFELNERLEREKKDLEDQHEAEITKLKEEFQRLRSTRNADRKKLVMSRPTLL